MTKLEFWFDFASPYSYLSAMRIETLAAECGVEIAWKPFLLGPLFKAQGWETSPFNVYPAKGRYMVRDMERLAEARGLKFRLPVPFPQQGLYAARLALLAIAEGWGAGFVKAVFVAEFADGADIGGRDALADILAQFPVTPSTYLAAIETPAAKAALMTQTGEAAARGIFGAPGFITPDGELFWGDDRLEQALAWARRERRESQR